MDSNKNKPKTIKIPIIISIVLSITIILLILYFTIDKQTINYLTSQNIRYEFFLAALGINFLYWVLWGERLRILCNAIDENVNISLWESTKIIITNLFLANITPSMAGGEPVRIYLLNKDGLSVGGATASVLGERLLDAVFLLICVPFAFLVFRDRIELEALRIGITIAIGVFILLFVLFGLVIKYPKKTKSFLIILSKKLSRFSKKKSFGPKIIEKINSEVDNFHSSMVFFLSKGKAAFIKAGFMTAIFWITGWLVPIFILMGLGLEPFIIESCAAQVILIIIVMMPTTPGGAGVTEGSTAALYSLFIGSSLVGVFVVLFRFITFHVGLIAGGIFQYRIFKSVASFSLETIKKEK